MTIWHTGKIQRYSRITYDIAWNVVLFFLIVGFIGIFFAGGIGVGYFASLVKDEPVRAASDMEQAIYDYEETSTLYFDNNIYFGDVNSDLHRDEIKLDQVSDKLINAVIATEDEYFRTHNGIVPKAILRALVQEATNSSSKSGGSTLTQQLIKNQILTNEVSFERKAKEILLAMRLENFFDKDEILEAYLNVVPYGREASGQNIAGVQTAAKGVFGVDAKDLTLPQAAFLAGLPKNPYAYTPFKNHGGLKSKEALEPGLRRMEAVLQRMYEEEYISEKEYKDALAYDLTQDFTSKQTAALEKYPYLTFELQDRAQDIIKEVLADKDGYTLDDLSNDEDLNEKYDIMAERNLRRNGYQIHSTINKGIYDALQKAAQNFEHYGPDWEGKIKLGDETFKIKQRVEVGAYMIDNSTGRTIAFVGGRGYDQENQVNFTTRVRSNGSTMKPLLVYGPAMEKGEVQPGSPILDAKTTFPGREGYTPQNVTKSFSGMVSARHALANSINIPAIKTYGKINDENIVDQYLKPMGINTLGEDEYSHLSLAIGATSHGVTVEDNVNAFSTISNNGKFKDTYMIDKITTKEGDVIYEHEVKQNDVFSPQTNYLLMDMLRDVMNDGTGVYAQSYLNNKNIDWFGKSGTSQDTSDVWFVGGNPNITFGTWMGYQYQKSLDFQGYMPYYKRSGLLWATLVNAAADVAPELVLPDERFQRPDGIVERSYCAVSGMLPSDLCQKVGLVKTDLFNAKYAPKEEDDSLVTGSYVMVDGRAVIAGPNTPQSFVKGDGVMFNPEFLKRKGYDKLDDLTDIYSKLNPEAWKKIGIPNTNFSNQLKNDGKAPSAPPGLKSTGGKLVWKKPMSNNIIGYYIYRASQPGGSFTKIGQSTDTAYSISGQKGIYRVVAVDYFGNVSDPSNTVKVGSLTETKDDKKEKPDQNKDKNKDKNKDGNNHNNGGTNNGGSGNGNGSGNGGNNGGSGDGNGSGNGDDNGGSGGGNDSGNGDGNGGSGGGDDNGGSGNGGNNGSKSDQNNGNKNKKEKS
nr:transglycosylase domain-containing protein [Lentibacillus sp. JNUCC-1]